LFFSALVLSACSGAGKKLDSAIYEIPVYEPAELTGQMGSTSGGDGWVVSGMGWFFKSPDSQEKISQWYKKKLPSAEKTENEEGDIVFTFKPRGSEEHELVQIFIKKDRTFTIHEDVSPGKRK